jgi:pimeloyl-ACP methyl ester carboxylesterase
MPRFLHAVATSLAPAAAGRWATDVFSDTRSFAGPPSHVLPLGARAVDTAAPGVREVYLWGEGGGPPALLVHGWGADSSSMHPLVAPLRALGHTVAAFDAPAHGVNPGRTATMTQYTAAVAAVLAELGGATVIVAHSLGAIAAVSGAVSAGLTPDRVVLIAPTCTLSGVLDRWAPTTVLGSAEVRHRIRRELRVRNGVPVEHWDVRLRGAGLGCPVLAVHDPGDPIVPHAEAVAIAGSSSRVRLVDAPGRGHFGILAAPEVRAAVTAFVAGQARPA